MSNFLEILNKAAEIVTEKYPGARFYETSGEPEGGSGTNADDVQTWEFVFWNTDNNTIILHYDKGIFGKPEYIPHGWVGDCYIDLPIKRSLSNAIELKNKAGYTDPFNRVILRWPLYPGATEPYYIFGLFAQGIWVFVGVYSGKVTTEPLKK